MLKPWTKILPFFLVERIAREQCERFVLDGIEYVRPYRRTLIDSGRNQ